ncbi:MAG: PEP-CTERM sorting domain-containing protein [Planctomycetales bacterium]|nr:PEP-CTERM sorting domain-containing protein [Planctomycetales bacterium]
MSKRISRITAILCLLAFVPTSFGIETAGELYVNLDAANATLAGWTNPGTYGDFEAFGRPLVTEDVTPSVYFDGSSAYFGQTPAPEGLVGLDPTRSIEVWAYNIDIADEETLVSWGKRGGPDGTNMAFNYGRHGNFGAVGHWGGDNPDIGWIDNDFTAGAPEAGAWHHLVYTYDEETARVYSDGELWNEEDMTQFGGLNTHADTAIAIASQWEGNGVDLTPALKANEMWISRVRIHDGVLSDSQILANYNEEKGSFSFDPTVPTGPPINPVAVPAGPIHRYNFNNPAAGDASEATIEDIVGGANGIVLGEGSSFNGSELILDGGGSDFAAYVDLPNGIMSQHESITFEGWVTVDGIQSWQRVFDFGSNNPGGDDGELEDVGDDNGGNTEGMDYFFLSAARGDNISDQRLEIRNEDPAGGGITTIDSSETMDEGDSYHFVVAYEAAEGGGGTITYYRDGKQESQGTTGISLSEINDVNNWLGRSNWTNDANLQGSFDEFRIYDYALTNENAKQNFNDGPNVLTIGGGGELGDVNGDGVCDAADIDAVAAAVRAGDTDAKYDLDGSGTVDSADHTHLVTVLKNTYIGDSNLDGEFNSSDFVAVFTVGEYEDGVDGNSTWADGDWNGDGDFTSGDFVAAFTDAGYEKGAKPPVGVPEPSTAALLLLGILSAAATFRRLEN